MVNSLIPQEIHTAGNTIKEGVGILGTISQGLSAAWELLWMGAFVVLGGGLLFNTDIGKSITSFFTDFLKDSDWGKAILAFLDQYLTPILTKMGSDSPFAGFAANYVDKITPEQFAEKMKKDFNLDADVSSKLFESRNKLFAAGLDKAAIATPDGLKKLLSIIPDEAALALFNQIKKAEANGATSDADTAYNKKLTDALKTLGKDVDYANSLLKSHPKLMDAIKKDVVDKMAPEAFAAQMKKDFNLDENVSNVLYKYRNELLASGLTKDTITTPDGLKSLFKIVSATDTIRLLGVLSNQDNKETNANEVNSRIKESLVKLQGDKKFQEWMKEERASVLPILNSIIGKDSQETKRPADQGNAKPATPPAITPPAAQGTTPPANQGTTPPAPTQAPTPAPVPPIIPIVQNKSYPVVYKREQIQEALSGNANIGPTNEAAKKLNSSFAEKATPGPDQARANPATPPTPAQTPTGITPPAAQDATPKNTATKPIISTDTPPTQANAGAGFNRNTPTNQGGNIPPAQPPAPSAADNNVYSQLLSVKRNKDALDQAIAAAPEPQKQAVMAIIASVASGKLDLANKDQLVKFFADEKNRKAVTDFIINLDVSTTDERTKKLLAAVKNAAPALGTILADQKSVDYLIKNKDAPKDSNEEKYVSGLKESDEVAEAGKRGGASLARNVPLVGDRAAKWIQGIEAKPSVVLLTAKGVPVKIAENFFELYDIKKSFEEYKKTAPTPDAGLAIAAKTLSDFKRTFQSIALSNDPTVITPIIQHDFLGNPTGYTVPQR